MKVYLDNAATTPLDPQVYEAMQPYLKEGFGNPSSTHFFGRESKSAIEAARKKVAEIFCKIEKKFSDFFLNFRK